MEATKAFPAWFRRAMRFPAVWLVFLMLCGLEIHQRYYFCQDDNRDYLVPFWVHSSRALAEGEVALFNFYQSLGTTHLAVGQSGALHPLVFLSVTASDALLGHPFGAIDLFVGFHLVLASLGAQLLGQRLLKNWAAASLFALSWGLNPAVLYVCKSWSHVSVLASSLPLMSWALVQMVTHRGKRWTRATVLVAAHLDLFLVGYVQWVVLALLFEGFVLLLLLSPQLRRRSLGGLLKELALGGFVVLLLSLPLLLPMAEQVQDSASRAQALAYREFAAEAVWLEDWLRAQGSPWSPFPAAFGRSQRAFFTTEASPPGVLHLGYLTLVGLAVVPQLIRRGASRQRIVLLTLAALSLFFLLWAVGALSPVLYSVPLLNRFRWPFKMIFFTNFCVLLAAAAGLGALTRRVRRPRLRRTLLGVSMVVMASNLLLAVETGTRRAFFWHEDPLPLVDPGGMNAGEGRIATFGFDTWRAKGRGWTHDSMAFNYATLHQKAHFSGYEPLQAVSKSSITEGLDWRGLFPAGPDPELIRHLRSWSVRWYVLSPDLEQTAATHLRDAGFRLLKRGEHGVLFEDPKASPLVVASGGACTFGPVEIWVNQLRFPADCVRTAPTQVNVACHDNLGVEIDAEPAPSSCDDHRVEFLLPPGHQTVVLRYRDPRFDLALLISVCGLLMLSGAGVWLWRRGPRPMRDAYQRPGNKRYGTRRAYPR